MKTETIPLKYIEGVLEALIFAEFRVLFKNVMQGEEMRSKLPFAFEPSFNKDKPQKAEKYNRRYLTYPK